MAIIDAQNLHRNRQISRQRISRGELTFADDKPVAGNKYAITAVPAGVALTHIFFHSAGAGTVKGTISIGTDEKQLTAKEDKVGKDTLEGTIYNEAQVVYLKLDNDLPKGRVVVGVKFLDLDNVTGETVPYVKVQ